MRFSSRGKTAHTQSGLPWGACTGCIHALISHPPLATRSAKGVPALLAHFRCVRESLVAFRGHCAISPGSWSCGCRWPYRERLPSVSLGGSLRRGCDSGTTGASALAFRVSPHGAAHGRRQPAVGTAQRASVCGASGVWDPAIRLA